MQNKHNSQALKAGTWYVASNFLIKAIALLTTPIIARLLTPDDYGLSTTYLSVYSLVTIIGTLDLYSSVQIANFDFDEEEMNSFMSSILSLSTITLIILYLIVKLFPNLSMDLLGLNQNLINFLFLNVGLTNAYTLMQTRHRAQLRYKQFVFLAVLISILSPLLSIFLINTMSNNLYLGRIIGNALPQMFVSVFIFIVIFIRGKSFYNKNFWNYALKVSIPLIPHHLSGSILNQADRIMINNMVGSFEVGLYSLAYSYASILQVLWMSFNQAWVPWFYGQMKDKNIKNIKKLVKPYTILFSFFYIVMLVIGPEALKIFGPSEYWDGMWVIPPVLLGIFFQFIYSLYVNIEFYLKKTNYIAIGTLIAASLNVVLNYIAIPKFGYISAAYTTLIGYVVLFILHYFIVKNWITTDIIGIKFILMWIAFILFATMLITILYPYIFIRYFLLVVLAILLLSLYYKQIFSTIKMLISKEKQ